MNGNRKNRIKINDAKLSIIGIKWLCWRGLYKLVLFFFFFNDHCSFFLCFLVFLYMCSSCFLPWTINHTLLCLYSALFSSSLSSVSFITFSIFLRNKLIILAFLLASPSRPPWTYAPSRCHQRCITSSVSGPRCSSPCLAGRRDVFRGRVLLFHGPAASKVTVLWSRRGCHPTAAMQRSNKLVEETQTFLANPHRHDKQTSLTCVSTYASSRVEAQVAALTLFFCTLLIVYFHKRDQW